MANEFQYACEPTGFPEMTLLARFQLFLESIISTGLRIDKFDCLLLFSFA